MNKAFLLSLAIVAVFASSANALFRKTPEPELTMEAEAAKRVKVDPGQPLFLTPYIQSGQIQQAQKLAKNEPLIQGLTSFSGYITVDNTTGSNMFFWGFETPRNQGKAPLVLWLQGGPGASSLFGLFVENGPVQVDANLNISPRPTSWATQYNMVFIDNPVGTGFSFVTDPAGYRKNEDDVADHLYKFFVQFYTLFPDLMDQPLYVAGESYAGKYVPALSMKLAQMEKMYAEQGKASPVAKLGGVLIGNGLSDPETMLAPGADHLYNLGLLNEQQREYFDAQTQLAIEYIKDKDFKAAFDIFDYLINADFYPYPSYFQNVSGCTDYFNFLLCKQSPPEFGYYVNYLNLNSTRANIHVGSQPYNDQSPEVEKHIINDIMDTVKDRVEYLLTQTSVPVLYYSGNLDLIVPTVGTDNFLRSLNWAHHDDWTRINRTVWTDSNNEAVAYSMTAGTLTYAVIRDAGHMVPFDQPGVTLSMVAKFIGL